MVNNSHVLIGSVVMVLDQPWFHQPRLVARLSLLVLFFFMFVLTDGFIVPLQERSALAIGRVACLPVCLLP